MVGGVNGVIPRRVIGPIKVVVSPTGISHFIIHETCIEWTYGSSRRRNNRHIHFGNDKSKRNMRNYYRRRRSGKVIRPRKNRGYCSCDSPYIMHDLTNFSRKNSINHIWFISNRLNRYSPRKSVRRLRFWRLFYP